MNEHESFVVDTRRAKGNRRATPSGASRGQRKAPNPSRPSAGSNERPSAPGGQPTDRPRDNAAPGGSPAEPNLHRIASADGDVYVGGPNAPARGETLRMRPHSPRVGTPGELPPDGPGKKSRTKSEERKGGFSRGKKILVGVLLFALLWVGSLAWAGHSAWTKVSKVDALPSQHLASGGAGTNTLIVGSDGRAGLTTAQRKALGTGQAEGQRTDSIMVLHTGGPKPTLMSIPRDSYVNIPGHAKNKINASFSIGGPQLLIKTIEQSTGIHIDNYMEIGFGGFASVVDAVGGVDICVPRDMDDKKAHINLKKGCQTLNGANALGYVRARYSDPEGDIGRAKRQRQFLGALMKKISSPSNLLVPWKLKGLGESGAQGLSIDKGMSMFQAMSIMWTLKGFSGNSGNSVVVPIGNAALPTPAGEAVQWDPTRSEELFKTIRDNGDTAPFVTKSSAAASSAG